MIESDAAVVIRSGDWTLQATANASGGNYLYNAPNQETFLQLQFDGPTLEIIYIAGPQLGTLVIEVDDTVLRTVMTYAATTTYQQTAKIAYLTDEPHTLRVYAQSGGIIAVDAFRVEIAHVNEVTPLVSASPNMPRLPCNPTTLMDAINNPEGATPAITADGRYVIYSSEGNDPTIYQFDRLTCITTPIVSFNTIESTFSIRVSDDGQQIAVVTNYYGNSPPLACMYGNWSRTVRWIDRSGASPVVTNLPASAGPCHTIIRGDLSADGRYYVYANLDALLYLRDLFNGVSTPLVFNGTPITVVNNDILLTPDARYVVFESGMNFGGDDTLFSDVYIHDRSSGSFDRVSEATGGLPLNSSSSLRGVSVDGRYVLMLTAATNAVPNDTNSWQDLIVHDRQTLTTTRVNVASDGTQANLSTYDGDLSGDGRLVVFSTRASTLIPNDTNNDEDVFLHNLETHTTTLVSVSANIPDGQMIPANDLSFNPIIAANGSVIAFESGASDLVPGVWGGIYLAPIFTTGDRLALATPDNHLTLHLNLFDTPISDNYLTYSHTPPSNGQWVMGDWDGDGKDTPGLYGVNGVFYYTNSFTGTPAWSGIWIGLFDRPAVVGRFSASATHDCAGVIDSGWFPPYGLAFVLYFACDLTTGTAPSITYQWLSVVLSDAAGFSGVHQFAAGDFDGDGVDTIAVRRGPFIAFTNVPPTTVNSAFDQAQYWGTPSAHNYGTFVAGDFDSSGKDSFGVYYTNGDFYYRQVVEWNPGTYLLQRVNPLGGAVVGVTTWR